MAEPAKGSRATFDPNKIYNVTEEEMRAIQERAQTREAMKKEFQKKVTNPYRGIGGYIHDPQIQRFLSMRATFWEQFKPAPKNFLIACSLTVVPISLYTYYLTIHYRERERKYRSGEVAYADRHFKFSS